MKKAVLSLSLLLLLATMAMALSAPHSSLAATRAAGQSSATAGQSSPAPSNDLRGCLGGSKGNYTLVDHQGKAHKVTGDDHLLWNEVGHEVDVTGKPVASNVFQETEITDIALRCWNFSLN